MEGACAARRQQLAAADRDVHHAAFHRLQFARTVGVADANVAQAAGFRFLFLRHGAQNRVRPGRLQLAAPQHAVNRVIGHGFQRAGLVRNGEFRQAVVLQLLFRHFLAVQQQSDLRRARVDLNVRLLALAASPAPRRHGVRHLPCGRRMLLAGEHDRANRDVRPDFLLQRDAGVQRFAQRTAVQVDAPRPRRRPAQPAELRRVRLVFPRPNADFTQIVHPRPDEIAHQTRVLLRLLAEAVRIIAERLAAQNQPVRILLQVVLVAVDAVVVARNVHVGKRVARAHVTAVQSRAALHELVAHQTREVIEELAADGLLLLRLHPGGAQLLRLFGFLLRLLVAVHAKADGGQEVEEDVDAAGDRAGIIQRMQVVRQLAGELDALLLRRFADLVARGVQDDARVVVVLVHHVGDVLLPPLVKVRHIVVFRFVDVPVVDVLVHHQHTEAVARVQQRLRAGIVRAADGVVAVFLQQADAALLALRIAARAEDALVVVDARALHNDALAVEQNALFAPRKGADAEGLQVLVAAEADAAGVEVRVLHVPQLCVGDSQRQGDFARRIRGGGCNLLFARKHIHRHAPRADGAHGNLHRRGIDGHRADANAVQGDMLLLIRRPQHHRAIDARAGIPAAVGLIAVAGNHAQLVFLVKADAVGQIRIEIRVAVRALGNLLAVQVHLRQMVHALKFQHQRLVAQGLIRRKAADVLIVAPLVPAAVDAVCGQLRAGFRLHGVVRDGDGDEVFLAVQMAEEPAGVPSGCFHRENHPS